MKITASQVPYKILISTSFSYSQERFFALIQLLQDLKKIRYVVRLQIEKKNPGL
jgi:hypothetical protein